MTLPTVTDTLRESWYIEEFPPHGFYVCCQIKDYGRTIVLEQLSYILADYLVRLHNDKRTQTKMGRR